MPISSSRFPPWNLWRRGMTRWRWWRWCQTACLKSPSLPTYLARKWVIPNSGRDCQAWMKRIFASMRLIWATFWWASRIRAEIWPTHHWHVSILRSWDCHKHYSPREQHRSHHHRSTSSCTHYLTPSPHSHQHVLEPESILCARMGFTKPVCHHWVHLHYPRCKQNGAAGNDNTIMTLPDEKPFH